VLQGSLLFFVHSMTGLVLLEAFLGWNQKLRRKVENWSLIDIMVSQIYN